VGYHAELATKRRTEQRAQRDIDAAEQRRREERAYQLAVRRAEEAQRLADHLHDMVQVDPALVLPPSGVNPIGLPVLKVWTRPAHLRRTRFGCGNVLEMWHGTKHTSLAAIAKEGFRRGREGCLFGSGIYFSRDITKALNYGQGSTAMGIRAITLLRCAVATGVHLNASTESWRSALDSGSIGPTARYNSVWAPGQVSIAGAFNGSLLREEWVVYSPLQVEVLEVYFWTEEIKLVLPVVKPWVTAPVAPKPVSKQRVGAKQRLAQQRRDRNVDTSVQQHHHCVRDGAACRFASTLRKGDTWLSLCRRHSNKIIGSDRLGLGTLQPFCSNYSL
jgi:hypothetical protein